MIDWAATRRELVGEYCAANLPKIYIPTMPRALIEFLQLADDPEIATSELGKCVERDVGLTCELLKYANSSAVAVRNKVSTAQRAITVLGIHRSKLTLMTAAVQKSLKPKNLGDFDYDGYSACNCERALFAQHFAERLGADADLAFASGMLVDCLLPKLFTEQLGVYSRYAATSPNEKPPLTDVERDLLGWTHASAAAQIMLGWQFPDDLICCVALHHQGKYALTDPVLGRSSVAAVALASLIPDPLMQVPGGADTLLKINQMFPKLDGLEIAVKVAGQLAEMSIPMGKHVACAEHMQTSLAQTT